MTTCCNIRDYYRLYCTIAQRKEGKYHRLYFLNKSVLSVNSNTWITLQIWIQFYLRDHLAKRNSFFLPFCNSYFDVVEMSIWAFTNIAKLALKIGFCYRELFILVNMSYTIEWWKSYYENILHLLESSNTVQCQDFRLG